MLKKLLLVIVCWNCLALNLSAQHGSDLFVAKPVTGKAAGLYGTPSGSTKPLTVIRSNVKVSTVANGKDVTTGWATLSYVDIVGSLETDVPCIVERCKVTCSGLYTVANSKQVECIFRDCEFNGPIGLDGKAVSAVVLYPRVMQRCVVNGGIDGIKIGNKGSCLIEDCIVYGQHHIGDSHSDAVQMVGGSVGPADTWVFKRCRIEGSFRGPVSAMILQAKGTGHVSGITLDSCYFSGGGWTVQTRQFAPYVMTKLKVKNCLWEKGSGGFGSYGTNVLHDEWTDNYEVEVTSKDINASVVVVKKFQMPTPKLSGVR